MAVGLEVEGDDEDSVVVAAVVAHGARHQIVGSMIELDPDAPALVVDDRGIGEAAVVFANLLQAAQNGSSGPAEFRVVPLGLEFGQNDDGEDYVVVAKRIEGGWRTEQHRSVEDVGRSLVYSRHPMSNRRHMPVSKGNSPAGPTEGGHIGPRRAG